MKKFRFVWEVSAGNEYTHTIEAAAFTDAVLAAHAHVEEVFKDASKAAIISGVELE